MSKKLFFRPKPGVCADFIPYYDKGKFQLFFLRDYRDKENFGEGTPWQLTTTSDFIDFSEEITILERGSIEEQDLYVFTGSVIKVDDIYHIFYTGHNPHLRKKGLPEQAVMHAVSKDGINYKKIKEDTFFALSDEYEIHDWRDPFVYYDEEKKKYMMLLAARLKKGPAIRRGCTVVCTSTDLKTWELEDKPLWAPNAYFTHECPDYFKIGDWHYLIYSEFSDQCKTRYRMSKDGVTWIAPKVDSFDGRAYYAAKTAFDGNKRYIFGWIPTKANNDHDSWNWGGSLAVHEIYQDIDGCLYERMPETIYNSFNKVIVDKKEIKLGSFEGTRIEVFGEQPKQFLLECEMEADELASRFGVLLSYDDELDHGYAYNIDNTAGDFSLNVFPNHPWSQANFINVFRKHEPKKVHKLQILFEENVCVAYLDDKYALSVRLYPDKLEDLKFGLLACDGIVSFKNVVVKVRK